MFASVTYDSLLNIVRLECVTPLLSDLGDLANGVVPEPYFTVQN